MKYEQLIIYNYLYLLLFFIYEGYLISPLNSTAHAYR